MRRGLDMSFNIDEAEEIKRSIWSLDPSAEWLWTNSSTFSRNGVIFWIISYENQR